MQICKFYCCCIEVVHTWWSQAACALTKHYTPVLGKPGLGICKFAFFLYVCVCVWCVRAKVTVLYKCPIMWKAAQVSQSSAQSHMNNIQSHDTGILVWVPPLFLPQACMNVVIWMAITNEYCSWGHAYSCSIRASKRHQLANNCWKVGLI